jgi:hypothetical protein
MPEDTTKEIQFKREICSQCWYQNECVTYNVNGRCDRCGGTDWIDAGITQEDATDETLQELHESFEAMKEVEPNTSNVSSRQKVHDLVEDKRNHPSITNPLRKSSRFYEGE